MQEIPFRVKPSSWLARLAAWKLGVPSVALTLGSTIHLHNASVEQLLKNPAWLRHELCHVRQFYAYGRWGFLTRYLAESLRKGYYQNRYEVAARAAEQDPRFDPQQVSRTLASGSFRTGLAG